MPVYTSPEALKANKLPWVDIDDYEFIYLGRTGMTQAHNTQQAQQSGHRRLVATGPQVVAVDVEQCRPGVHGSHSASQLGRSV